MVNKFGVAGEMITALHMYSELDAKDQEWVAEWISEKLAKDKEFAIEKGIEILVLNVEESGKNSKCAL